MTLEYDRGLMPPTFDLWYPDESISMVMKAKDFLDVVTNGMEEIEYALMAYTSPHCFSDDFDDEFEVIKDWCLKYPKTQIIFNVEMGTPDDGTIYLAVYILKNGKYIKIRHYKDDEIVLQLVN